MSAFALLLSPGVAPDGGEPWNLGDVLIERAIGRELRDMLPGAEVRHASSHGPLSAAGADDYRKASAVLLGGSNMLGGWRYWRRQWHVQDAIVKQAPHKAVSIGCGWQRYGAWPTPFVRRSLATALRPSGPHSVRDEYTRRRLAGLGVTGVINTGCPTMWTLADEVKGGRRSPNVMVTLTDYARDDAADHALLALLAQRYDHLYIWPQGKYDCLYLSRFLGAPLPLARVTVLPRSIDAFEHVLRAGDVDYVGTRLHAGIHALRHAVSVLIVSVDNRAAEIGRDTGLPVVARGDIDGVRGWLSQVRTSPLRLPRQHIAAWKASLPRVIEWRR